MPSNPMNQEWELEETSGVQVLKMRTEPLPLTEADRQVVIQDMANIMLIDIDLRQKRREHSPGFFRTIGRFVFRHEHYEDDRFWQNVTQHGLWETKVRSLHAHLAFDGNISMPYYDAGKRLSSLDYYARTVGRELPLGIEPTQLEP